MDFLGAALGISTCITTLRKCSVTQKFIDSLLQKKTFTFAATSYGSANEKVATNLYRKILGTMSTTVAW